MRGGRSLVLTELGGKLDILAEIGRRQLDVLTEVNANLARVLAIIGIQGVAEPERVGRLREMGLDLKTIGSVTGLSSNAVAVRLFRRRKARARR